MFKIKHLPYLLIFVLTPGFFNSCKGQDNSDDSLFSPMNLTLLSYVQEQLSGQCAVISRNELPSGEIQYTASGYNVPKSYCNAETVGPIVTSDASVALATLRVYYDKQIAGNQGHDACRSQATTYTNGRNGLNEAYLEAQLGSKQCVTFLAGERLLYYCTDTIAAKARDNTRYQFIEDVVSDMNEDFESRKTALKTAQATNKLSDTAINQARMITLEERSIEHSPEYQAYFYGSANPECQKAILDANPEVRALVLKQSGANAILEFTEAEASALTETIIVSDWGPLKCHYGAGTPSLPAGGICPDSYPRF